MPDIGHSYIDWSDLNTIDNVSNAKVEALREIAEQLKRIADSLHSMDENSI